MEEDTILSVFMETKNDNNNDDNFNIVCDIVHLLICQIEQDEKQNGLNQMPKLEAKTEPCESNFTEENDPFLQMPELLPCDILQVKLEDKAIDTSGVKLEYSDSDDEDSFTCPFCLAVFKEANRLIQHLKVHEDDSRNQFNYDLPPKIELQCENCGVCTFDQSRFLDHISKCPAKDSKIKCKESYSSRISELKTGFPNARPKFLNCQFCSFSCPTDLPENLRLHMSSFHRGKKGNSCNVCGKVFPCLSELTRHALTHTGETPFQCNKCGRRFTRIYHLRRHHGRPSACRTESKIPPPPNFKLHCQFCDYSCNETGDLRRHILTSHKEKKGKQCRICGKLFPWPSALARHMLTHTGETPFQCNNCGRRFNAMSHLRRHNVRSACGMKSNAKAASQPSINRFTGESQASKKFNCQFCDYSSSIPGDLRKHMLSFHKEKKGQQCRICGKVFSRPSKLKNHIGTHTGETPFQCDKCGRRFRLEYHLRRHNVRYGGCCNESNTKTASQNAIKKSHRASAEFPVSNLKFNCQFCDYSSSVTGDLRRHMLSFHKEKKGRQCRICGKVFAWPSKLKCHMRAHNQESSFQCSICSRRFRESYHLRRHLETVHRQKKSFVKLNWQSGILSTKQTEDNQLNSISTLKAKPHQCEHCSFATRRSYSLRRHIKRMHSPTKSLATSNLQSDPFKGKVLDKQINSKSPFKDKLHRCEKCAFVTEHSWNLRRHEKRMHKKKKKVSFAEGTKFEFNSEIYIKTDLSEKEQLRLSSCKIVLTRCDNLVPKASTRSKAKVTARPSLKASYKMVTIKGEKLFQCSVCRKTCRHHHKIIAHFRTHTNEKPFKCPTCFRAFRFRENLHVHRRTHMLEEDKPFKCVVCSKTFTVKNGLVDHMNSHFGLKPHECNVCHKTFTFRSNLSSHKKRNH